ncbi:MAG: MBL fold metallo-hydrolase [Lachnospiraceae bacterium]|nr:MBL fold metallo-hydrolase [Lachnospiraceae bacterium]
MRIAGISLIISLVITGCGREAQTVSDSEETVTASDAEETVAAPDSKETVTAPDSEETAVSDTENNKLENPTDTENTETADITVPEADELSATLLYQGHGSVRIVTGDEKVIYIDPFMGDGYDLPADLILMTHGHYDHTKEDLIASKNQGCTVIKWSDALENGEYHNYDFGFVSVEAVEAGYNKNHDVSECVGFILTFPDGIKAYFSGDTSTTPSMAGFAERKLDYAFLCCDGVYNMDAAEASECAKAIGARHTIPYHMEPVKDKSGFDMSVAKSFDAPGKIILQPGEELVLE